MLYEVITEIQRLRRRMTSLEKRHRIHQDNIDLHLGLFDRITEMEAMELKRVSQQGDVGLDRLVQLAGIHVYAHDLQVGPQGGPVEVARAIRNNFV